jgi:hypothetical protein
MLSSKNKKQKKLEELKAKAMGKGLLATSRIKKPGKGLGEHLKC